MEQATIKIGNRDIVFETGEIAKQAHGSIVVKHKDTVVLVTVVAEENDGQDSDFFPLTVEYREKMAAAGRIPGGFVKRESRPQEHEILASRLVDRSIRPLFPEAFCSETQVMATVFSYDPDADPEPLAILGAAAALTISDIPWNGPLGGIRLSRKNNRFIALPTMEEKKDATMDLVISCSQEGLVMLEGESKEVTEKEVLDGILFTQKVLQPFFDFLKEWQTKIGKPKREIIVEPLPIEIAEQVKELAQEYYPNSICGSDKKTRYTQLTKATTTICEKLEEALGEQYVELEKKIKSLLEEQKHTFFRRYIVENKQRADGRNFTQVRPITIKTGWLPRNHGSVLFTRGETQALVSCTLGTPADEQIVETLSGETRQRFMLHYNFPPYSVGEVRGAKNPGRREIGHGFLASRALEEVLPAPEDFPYTIRIISDITESNGSSSMATVCGGCLALMNAGVPIRNTVAGIAMGLIQENDTTIVLTDIMGEEDHLGDMDFKVAGSRVGITALQMDNKIGSLSAEVLEQALAQAKEARFHILQEMEKAQPSVASTLSPFAPRIKMFTIRKDRIRDLIGPGGKNIQEIQETFNVKVDVESNTGKVSIFCANEAQLQEAYEKIHYLTGEPEVDKCYQGEVVSIKQFGAFVRLFNNVEGLVHISEFDTKRVENVTDYVQEGDKIMVKVLGVDRQGKIRLSYREALNVPKE
ncbi:MAG TPA: polyribonucleotide nucleotidyltransferase [Planctomycetota bacterium]|nr:polyribonucleotide nucleotidyltransferase [Planctomycetota bacterium]